MRFGEIRAIREKKGLGSIARRHLRNCRTAKGMASKIIFDTHHLPPVFRTKRKWIQFANLPSIFYMPDLLW
jgi:hypothetical protein